MSKLHTFAYPAVAALALAAAFSAHAQEGPDYDFASSRASEALAAPAVKPVVAPVLSRTAVQSQVVTVRGNRAAPAVDSYGETYNPYAEFKSTKTRAQVVAEMMAVPRNNRLAAIYGEDIGPFFYAELDATERAFAQRTTKGSKSAIGQ